MGRMRKGSQDVGGDTATAQRHLPWAWAVLVFVVLMAVGYSLDNDRSLSEQQGVVTQSEAENDVIPSLSPQ